MRGNRNNSPMSTPAYSALDWLSGTNVKQFTVNQDGEVRVYDNWRQSEMRQFISDHPEFTWCKRQNVNIPAYFDYVGMMAGATIVLSIGEPIPDSLIPKIEIPKVEDQPYE